MDRTWWQDGVVYQIYPRSLLDTDGDGVGDLEGVRRTLDHIAWLGVDALWLSPFFTSPMKDFGYDVADYCDVDPVFGDLAGFDRLVADAHERGLRVLIDWVPNHSSDEHPWFVESASSRDSAKADWYIWHDVLADDPDPSAPTLTPNDWISNFTDLGPAWTFHQGRGQWYLHTFLPGQPDLNWANPAVQSAMHDTLRFWLDRGVDGFRMDVIFLLGKPAGLPDLGIDHPATTVLDDPSTKPLVAGIKRVLAEYPERLMVGETYLWTPEAVAAHYGTPAAPGVDLGFYFVPMWTSWSASTWRRHIRGVESTIGLAGQPAWVLSSHDAPRLATRLGGGEARARCAAVLLLSLRGTPFLYAGDELGLEDAVVPPDRVVDPGGRDGCRAPIPWTAAADHGWGTADPWLPWPPQADAGRDLESLRADPSSVVWLHHRLLARRRTSAALRTGTIRLLESVDGVPDAILGFVRFDDATGDRRVVLLAFGSPAEVGLASTWLVETASDGAGEGAPFDGTLATDRAVILGPA